MDLNQQEQDIVDLLTMHKVMTSQHMCNELRWSTAKLHPVMAALEEKGVVESETDDAYPFTTTFALKKEDKS